MWKNAVIAVLSIIFLFSAFPLHQAIGQPTPTISVQLSTTSVLNENETCSANITVSNVNDLYAWSVMLFYNNNLNATQADEGPFLKAKGDTSGLLVFYKNNYNGTHGWINLACTLLGSAPGADGSGTLATVTFTAVGAGVSVLHFDTTGVYGGYKTELSDHNTNMISFTTVDGQVSTIPEYSSLTILSLFMIVALVSLIALRRRKMTGVNPTH
jgi:hypothetical protein